MQLPKRGEGKIKIDIKSQEQYDYYVKTTGNPLHISKRIYTEIREKFFKKIMEKVITEAYEYRFPYKMGYLLPIKYKKKIHYADNGLIKPGSFSIDYGATLKLWEENPEAAKNKKVLVHLNEHSNGFTPALWWDRRSTIVTNLRYYSFKPTRDINRTIAKVFKDPHRKVDYFEKPRVNYFRKRDKCYGRKKDELV